MPRETHVSRHSSTVRCFVDFLGLFIFVWLPEKIHAQESQDDFIGIKDSFSFHGLWKEINIRFPGFFSFLVLLVV